MIQKTVFKVSDFLSWQRSKTLVLSPAFQRRPVWPTGAKSLLIDTILSGIPMPIVFLRDISDLKTLDPQRQVVDGQQRIRTLISFIQPSLLDDITEADQFTVLKVHNARVAGLEFAKLQDEDKLAILNYEMSVHVLPSDTEDRDVLKIFARMNSTGYKLNDQELRNAEFYGYFKQTCYDLSLEQLQRWREWRVFAETDIARMAEVEEVGELIITMIDGIHGRRQKTIRDYYKKYNESFPQEAAVRKRFSAVLDAIASDLGHEMKDLVFRRRSLFNTLFAVYYDVMYKLKSPLDLAKARSYNKASLVAGIRKASDAILNAEPSDPIYKVLRGATGDKGSREKRLAFVMKYLGSV